MKNNNSQQRNINWAGSKPSIETRAEGETKKRYITGYAAKFNVWSQPLGYGGWFREKIDPKAFDNVLKNDVVCVFNHSNDKMLGRNLNTLALSVDEVGLKYDCLVPDTATGDEVFELLQRGDITGSSFRFVPKTIEESKSDQEGIEIDRTVKELELLIDVGPVTFPAYPDATSEAAKREYEQFIEENQEPANTISKWQTELAEKELELINFK